jgi:hypothetical protein
MNAPSLTKRNPDPDYRRLLIGNRTAWFKPADQQATAPANSSLDRHSDRPTVPQTPPARTQQLLQPHPPRSAILIAAIKSP